jgi:serine/threonine-protein kinase RsbW
VSSNTRTNVALLSVTAGPLAGPVLARVIAMLAARANLPIDRLNDAVLLGDAIAAAARPVVADGRVRVEIGARPAGLVLRIGPLTEDGAERLRESARMPGAGDVLERLADEIRVERDAAGEFLLLDVAADRG